MRTLSPSSRSAADSLGQSGTRAEPRRGVERWLSEACIRAALGDPPHQSSIPVLRNAWLDRWFARAHPALPALVFGPLVLALSGFALEHAGAGRATFAFACGVFGFSLFEYGLHRFVFHHAFGAERHQRIAAFLTHGYHHSYPRDPDRLVLPPLLTAPFALLLATLLFGLLTRAIAAAAFAGTAAGYVAYDSMHWWIHHGRAKSALGRWCKRYHLLHHHDPMLSRFGVSSPVWDLVFGTYRAPRRTSPDGAK